MNRKNKFARYGGVFFILLFVAATFVINTGIIYPKYESSINTTNFPVVYSKDNTLCIAPLDKKAVSLSDFLTTDANTMPVVYIADNGNAVCFFENYDSDTQTGSLFVTYDGKEKIPVSGKAYKRIYMSADGSKMLYAEKPDLNKGSGKLVLWEKNGEKAEISDRVNINNFNMDKTDGSVFYVEYSEDADGGDLYIKKSKAEKIDSGVFRLVNILSSSSVVYTKKNGESRQALYYWKAHGEAQKLSEDMLDFRKCGIDSKSFAWCADDGRLMVKRKNKVDELDNGAANILKADASRENILYTKNFSPETYEYEIALVYKGGEPETIAAVSGNMLDAAVSMDFKKTAYIENNNLYIKEKGRGAKKEPVLIAEDAVSFEMSQNGRAIAYVSGGVLYLKCGKGTVRVSEDAQAYRFTPDGTGLCYIANYNEAKRSGNLFIKSIAKPDKEAVKIDSDVMYSFHARSSKNIVYIRSYNNETGEGELCVSRNGKVQVVDSGKVKILCEKY